TYKFAFDYQNRIVQVHTSSGNTLVASYTYDPMGRRVERAVAGGATTRFIYAGREIVCTYDGSNGWKQNYVWGEGRRLVMLEQADVLDYNGNSNTTEVVRSFYHRNAIGSVMEITDMNQAKVLSYR